MCMADPDSEVEHVQYCRIHERHVGELTEAIYAYTNPSMLYRREIRSQNALLEIFAFRMGGDSKECRDRMHEPLSLSSLDQVGEK